MNKTGVIVDGSCELLCLKRKYPNELKILVTDGPRGHCTPIDKIITNARKQINMLIALKCNKIVILIDFECRSINYVDFTRQINHEITKHKFSVPVNVVVTNKMIENWFLSDIEMISAKKSYITDRLKQKSYEGLHGKNELKKLFKRNYSYSETEHGPELFSIIRTSIAKKNSPSFLKFLESIA